MIILIGRVIVILKRRHDDNELPRDIRGHRTGQTAQQTVIEQLARDQGFGSEAASQIRSERRERSR